ncbi:MAG: dicarboxylate/amino acid:cation symporter, partial [Cyclobacteriaceae bacterium]|nr:dicarboxylate/amino acid:cation symporter [Cyclobacteriaceae bacterium]
MKIPIHLKIIIGLILGIIWAIVSSYMGWAEFNVIWIKPFGTIFINLLKLIAVPLVLFSIIAGVASLSDIKRLGRMGVKTLTVYLVTTFIAVTVGLALVNTYKPGDRINEDQHIDNRISYELWAKDNNIEILDNKCLSCDQANFARVEKIRKIMSLEPIDPTVAEKLETASKQKQEGPMRFIVDMIPSNIFVSLNDNSLMLQVIVFSIFFGVCLIMIPDSKSAPLLTIINSINEVFLKMVDVVMKGAPFFVFALLAGIISEMAGNNPEKVISIFLSLGHYSLVLFVGLAFMVIVFYPSILNMVNKKIGYKGFFKKFGKAQLVAFTTSSSAATLPVTMECVTENLKVSPKTANFVLPIGATVNMDGTSLYQAVAVVFLAQLHGVDLTLGQQLVIVFTATLASIGSAAVPSAGLIMMILVLQSVGLNPAWIGIIMAVDRPLDMCRTVVNVTGDAAVATLVANSEGELG